MRIIERYPDFREIYEEIAQFQVKPEELVGMYSKALEILDRNTVQYMIEEQKQEIEEQQREIEERKREIVEQQREIEEHKREMEEQQQEIEERKREIEEQQKEIERLKKLLEQR